MSEIITPDGAGKLFASALTRQALSKETDALRRSLSLRADNPLELSAPLSAFWAMALNLFNVTGVIAAMFTPQAIGEFEKHCALNDALGPGPMAVYLHTAFQNRARGRKINKRLPEIPEWIFQLIDSILYHDKNLPRPGHDE